MIPEFVSFLGLLLEPACQLVEFGLQLLDLQTDPLAVGLFVIENLLERRHVVFGNNVSNPEVIVRSGHVAQRVLDPKFAFAEIEVETDGSKLFIEFDAGVVTLREFFLSFLRQFNLLDELLFFLGVVIAFEGFEFHLLHLRVNAERLFLVDAPVVGVIGCHHPDRCDEDRNAAGSEDNVHRLQIAPVFVVCRHN